MNNVVPLRKPADNGTDPRIMHAQENLGRTLQQFFGGKPITARTHADMQDMVNAYAQGCRNRGIDIPKLAVVAITDPPHWAIWPAEMEHDELQKRLRMLVLELLRHGLQINPDELAKAVRRAYPDYSPSGKASLNIEAITKNRADQFN